METFSNSAGSFFCSVTEKGADASAAVMSIIETAKRNNLDVYGYLTHLLTVLPEWGKNLTDEQLESVMPWSESLPDFCRQEYDEIKRFWRNIVGIQTKATGAEKIFLKNFQNSVTIGSCSALI